MTTVIFYEKTGCSGNARQKSLLTAAGHQVIARDLRQEAWTRERLLAFFTGLPVRDWFNRSAPAVKSGAIVPESLDESAALALLLENPLLIRRPLLEAGGRYMTGFDSAAVHAWLGLGAAVAGLDVESCRHDAGHRCHDPFAA